jgi:hypothetical protein
MNDKLSPKEYKKLIIDIAKNISPVLISTSGANNSVANEVANYSKEITDAVNLVLKGIERKEK